MYVYAKSKACLKETGGCNSKAYRETHGNCFGCARQCCDRRLKSSGDYDPLGGFLWYVGGTGLSRSVVGFRAASRDQTCARDVCLTSWCFLGVGEREDSGRSAVGLVKIQGSTTGPVPGIGNSTAG